MRKHLTMLLSAVAIFLLFGCDSSLGGKSKVSALFKSADSSIAQMRYAKNGSDETYLPSVTYGPAETQQMARAILAGKRDRGVYDTPVSLHKVEFYSGSECVAEIATCGALFSFRGKQYRDASGILSKLVDNALDSAQETVEEIPEPSPQVGGQ